MNGIKRASELELRILQLVRDLEDQNAALIEHIHDLEYFARMVVNGQLTETEQERAIYRRGFRQLLDKKGINQ